MDFMSDSMVGGRKFRTFNVMDDCTREALAMEVDTSLSSNASSEHYRAIDMHVNMPIKSG
jgi:putative transposase